LPAKIILIKKIITIQTKHAKCSILSAQNQNFLKNDLKSKSKDRQNDLKLRFQIIPNTVCNNQISSNRSVQEKTP